MSTFGDFEDADSFDADAPDPEAVARLFVAQLFDLAPKGRKRDIDQELKPEVKALYVFAFALLLARLRREGGI